MRRRSSLACLPLLLLTAVASPGIARAGTEIKLDRDYLAGVIEKLPPSPFEKKGQYKGQVNSYRLRAIDPKRRRFLASCQVEGAFAPPASGPISERVSKSKDHEQGLRKFRFEITAGINVEAGPDGTPRFHVDVEEVKKAELEGLAGLLAKFMGRFFDEMVTQIADGRAAILNQKLNAEVAKRAAAMKEYGVLCGIDYRPDHVVLRFDLTRYKKEGIAGYVFAAPRPGAVPLYRFQDRRNGSHEFSLSPGGPGRPELADEGVACYVPDDHSPGSVIVYGWAGRHDRLYTTSADGEGAPRRMLKPTGPAFRVYPEPVPDSVPLYRFFDPNHARHFFTTHPYAEFAK
ncbi:hypothetical protein OJF2_02960 [Aquisphaera giovannonii]|uniref:DUF5648 domain-containing protein n=1 Tax=Aquisphaera giovannonii TaxID=406548 RepID=A0A5B9VVF5_9BACT|nr:hypothetical protein [Aquisphaera giovannonii]QEH31831.1 hypothetical protein OJF2_02960 [Aquisphaera giovannonii]